MGGGGEGVETSPMASSTSVKAPIARQASIIWLRERMVVARNCIANELLALLHLASALMYCMVLRMFVSPRSQMLRPPFRDRCFQFQLLS